MAARASCKRRRHACYSNITLTVILATTTTTTISIITALTITLASDVVTTITIPATPVDTTKVLLLLLPPPPPSPPLQTIMNVQQYYDHDQALLPPPPTTTMTQTLPHATSPTFPLLFLLLMPLKHYKTYHHDFFHYIDQYGYPHYVHEHVCCSSLTPFLPPPPLPPTRSHSQ